MRGGRGVGCGLKVREVEEKMFAKPFLDSLQPRFLQGCDFTTTTLCHGSNISCRSARLVRLTFMYCAIHWTCGWHSERMAWSGMG